MKLILLAATVLSAAFANAGAGGVDMTVCMSESGRTTFVYKIDEYADDIVAESSFAIDGQMFVTQSSKACLESGNECSYVNYDSDAKTVTAGAEESIILKVVFSEDEKSAYVTPETLNPKNYQEIGFEIDLKCSRAIENP